MGIRINNLGAIYLQENKSIPLNLISNRIKTTHTHTRARARIPIHILGKILWLGKSVVGKALYVYYIYMKPQAHVPSRLVHVGFTVDKV